MEELQKQYLQSKIEVQEATLTTLGKELHDNVGQLLSSAKNLLQVAKIQPENAASLTSKLIEIMDELHQVVRNMAKSMDSDYLKRFDLVENLEILIKRNNHYNNTLKIHISGDDSISLKPEDQIILFRIIQEGIQNAIKHAEAKNIFINIADETDKLIISVTDDGVGFDLQEKSNGIGLESISTRAKALKGMAVWNRLQPGTELVVLISKTNKHL